MNDSSEINTLSELLETVAIILNHSSEKVKVLEIQLQSRSSYAYHWNNREFSLF